MKKTIAVLAAMVMLCCCAFASAETLLYATNPEYPPFESMDDNNQVIGYDVDLINAIGEKIGIEFQAEAMAFDAVVSSVQTNPNMIGRLHRRRSGRRYESRRGLQDHGRPEGQTDRRPAGHHQRL